MGKRTLRLIWIPVALLAAALAPFAGRGLAETSPVRVYTSDGFKAALQALRPEIEHSLGRNLAVEFDASKTLERKIEQGQAFDVAILSTNVIDELIQQGKISADTRAELGRRPSRTSARRRPSRARFFGPNRSPSIVMAPAPCTSTRWSSGSASPTK